MVIKYLLWVITIASFTVFSLRAISSQVKDSRFLNLLVVGISFAVFGSISFPLFDRLIGAPSAFYGASFVMLISSIIGVLCRDSLFDTSSSMGLNSSINDTDISDGSGGD